MKLQVFSDSTLCVEVPKLVDLVKKKNEFGSTAYRHRVHVWLKVFAVRMSYLSISPSPFSCFMRRHFETTFPSAPSSSNSSRLVSTGQAHFRTSGGEFYLADSTHATSMKGSCSRQCSTTWNGQTKATRTSIGINPEKRQHLRQKIQPGHWCFFGPASERTWWNANSNEPQGQWDTVSLQMVVMFKCHTSHPVFPATEPLYQW